jgi:hypothetical protein
MKLDTFESVFRSAVKEQFRYEPPEIGAVAIVTDLHDAEAAELHEKVRSFLRVADPVGKMSYTSIGTSEYSDVPGMLGKIEELRPDLIVSYRNLRSHRDLPFTLGAYLDTLTQAVNTPVLVLPPPSRPDFDQLLADTNRIMVVTDHLTGDNRLVSWGIHMCADNGTLDLVHVEDDQTFERYVDAISKIPDIDTDSARERIHDKLLQMPRDYVRSIAALLAEKSIHEKVEPTVIMGHAITDYKRLIDDHEVDLLVLNTKDERQLAMHGMAYSLAIEIRDLPLLLL